MPNPWRDRPPVFSSVPLQLVAAVRHRPETPVRRAEHVIEHRADRIRLEIEPEPVLGVEQSRELPQRSRPGLEFLHGAQAFGDLVPQSSELLEPRVDVRLLFSRRLGRIFETRQRFPERQQDPAGRGPRSLRAHPLVVLQRDPERLLVPFHRLGVLVDGRDPRLA